MRYISFLCLLSLLTACHKAYPGLYAPEIDYENPNPEVTTDHVPIMLALYDPLYALVTTRGSGTFSPWNDETKARWMEARFGVYAFLTNNAQYTGGPDYRQDEIEEGSGGIPYCLIKDRKVKLTDNCELQWEDGDTRYYSSAYPEYKFNFFLYYTDDAKVTDNQPELGKITKHIEVDGTQDIISAYAYPDTNDRDKLVGEDDESRYLINHWNDVVYSARSGRRRIDPNFKVQHEMTQLQFSLKGDEKLDGTITIKQIRVEMPYKGTFTVARDWEGVRLDNAGNKPEIGVVWEDDRISVYMTKEEKWSTSGSDLDLSVDKNYENNTWGNPLLAPPASSYGITLQYTYSSEKYPGLEGKTFEAVFNKVVLSGGVAFSKGNKHTISLQIYGPQSISIKLDDGLDAWVPWGDNIGVGDQDNGWDYM